MTTFLTSQEMQELISVDRSTVYRMAEDGRLPGVKIGRQWRFPADRVAAQLGLADLGEPSTSAPTATKNAGGELLADWLPPDDLQQIGDLIGDLFGVMAVITDMEGCPLTAVANPCGYFEAIDEQPNAVEACLSQWRLFADEPNVAPRWVRTHLGFLCARTYLWVDLKPVGMIVVGGVTPHDWPPDRAFVETLAAETGIATQTLLDHIHETWDLDLAEERRVLRLLPQMGDLVSQLVTAHRLAAGRSPVGGEPGASNFHRNEPHPVPQGGDRS